MAMDLVRVGQKPQIYPIGIDLMVPDDDSSFWKVAEEIAILSSFELMRYALVTTEP